MSFSPSHSQQPTKNKQLPMSTPIEPFTWNPDLARASTIPASWYTSPGMLELEREKIFRRTWQYAASLDALLFPGNYLAVDVVGVPVVLTRDLDGTLRDGTGVPERQASTRGRRSL